MQHQKKISKCDDQVCVDILGKNLEFLEGCGNREPNSTCQKCLKLVDVTALVRQFHHFIIADMHYF